MLGNKFERDYCISTYETDKHQELRLVTLLNIFQDISEAHASIIGVGVDFCREHLVAWVGVNYHIVIDVMPKNHETIKIVSWPSEERKFGAIREFEVRDMANNVIIKASSQWLLIDIIKKRPVSLRVHLPEYFVVPERCLDSDFAKIPEVVVSDYEKSFDVRFDDIDLNNHVNNANYPLWATESVPASFRLENRVQEIEIVFKKECLYEETVTVKTNLIDNTSTHSIMSNNDGRVLSSSKIIWKRI